MASTLWLKAPAVLCLFAGMATAAQTPGFTATTTTTPDAYGLITVTIHNRSKSTITAVSIYHTCDVPDRTGSQYTWVGFDAALELSLGSAVTGREIPVSTSRTFDAASEQIKCPGGISVVFADGHGEGSPEGWKQILADRRAAYAELSAIKAVVGNMPSEETDFPKHLLELLDMMRLTVQGNRLIEIPRDEVNARDQVLNEFLVPLRISPDRVPKQLSNQTETLQALDRMMTHLQKFLSAEKKPSSEPPTETTSAVRSCL
jgi:hypothetical protein